MGRAIRVDGGGQQATSISRGDEDHSSLEDFVWELKPCSAGAVKTGGGASLVAEDHRGQPTARRHSSGHQGSL